MRGAKAGAAVKEHGLFQWAALSRSAISRPVSFRLPTARDWLEPFSQESVSACGEGGAGSAEIASASRHLLDSPEDERIGSYGCVLLLDGNATLLSSV